MNELTRNVERYRAENIADRSEVFYWQTDRRINPLDIPRIWIDRHKRFSPEIVLLEANSALQAQGLSLDPSSISMPSEGSQNALGNINTVVSGRLSNGMEVIVRCHPIGIDNGYFDVESLAAETATGSGIPSYSTIAIRHRGTHHPFAIQIIEKLPGTAVTKLLEEGSRSTDDELLFAMGSMMAKLHSSVKVSGFGPFNNHTAATRHRLEGLHKTQAASIRASLAANINVLVEMEFISSDQVGKIDNLFSERSPLLENDEPVLVHNDFAPWNLLTDGSNISGVLDWDECVGGHPAMDIACWSLFYPPDKLDKMLSGYGSERDLPGDFRDRFELMRLRYSISKMALRANRYKWDKTPLVEELLRVGESNLEQAMGYFNI